MAVTAMKTVTNQILFESGVIGPVTMQTNGVDIKPGMVVTATGETIHTRDIDIPGAADEVPFGIVGLNPDHEINDAYADNVAVPVYKVGSQAIVWGWIQANNGDKKANAPLNQTAASADGFAIAGELRNEYIGTVYEDCTVDASDDTPCLIRLD